MDDWNLEKSEIGDDSKLLILFWLIENIYDNLGNIAAT